MLLEVSLFGCSGYQHFAKRDHVKLLFMLAIGFAQQLDTIRLRGNIIFWLMVLRLYGVSYHAQLS